MEIPSNLREQISTIKDSEISYRMLHNNAVVNDINSNIKFEIPFESLINKYRDVLSNIVITINSSSYTIITAHKI